MSKELKTLIESLGITEDKVIKLSSGGSSLNHDFDINPEDFLQRAEDDYEIGGSAALLNSITNAKRAIHCQIDQALLCLGFNTKRWNLPKKAELLVRLGFVAPRILKRVTHTRNVLEHEYVSPTLEQVEEALDLAALFVEATNRHLEGFGHEFYIGNHDEQVDSFHFRKELGFHFGYEEKGFQIWGRTNVSPELNPRTDVEIGEAFIKPNDEIFIDIVRLVVAGDNEVKVKKALVQFFTTLNRY
jgi:hypothetical protein